MNTPYPIFESSRVKPLLTKAPRGRDRKRVSPTHLRNGITKTQRQKANIRSLRDIIHHLSRREVETPCLLTHILTSDSHGHLEHEIIADCQVAWLSMIVGPPSVGLDGLPRVPLGIRARQPISPKRSYNVTMPCIDNQKPTT